MAIIGETITEVDLHGVMRGENSVLRLTYFPDVAGEYAANVEFAGGFENNVVDNLIEFTSQEMTYFKQVVRQRGPNAGPEFTEFFTKVGLVVDDSLPPSTAFSFGKVPDNGAIEGANLSPFRAGGFRLMGVPENYQQSGLMDSASVSDIESHITTVHLFNVSTVLFGVVAYQMYMSRPPLTPQGPPDSAAPVNSVFIRSLLGTQNSRKLL